MASLVRCSSSVLCTLSLALRLAAQASTPFAAAAQPEAFSESIDVRVVNVEAVVVDAAGHRVRGLTAADFRLLVDDREVPIQYFAEVKDGVAQPPAGQQSRTLEPGPIAVPAPADGAVGRSILVFLDQELSIKAHLAQVLRGLSTQLTSLAPGDRVAIVAVRRGKISVLCDWTSNPDAIRSTLERAAKLPADGLYQARVVRDSDRADEDLLQVVSQVSEGNAEGQLSSFQEESGALRRTLKGAVVALRAFSSAPGRKIALLLAGGWPVGLEPRAFVNLADTANRLGYTLYPVDVPGVETPPTPTDISDQAAFNPGKARMGFLYSIMEKQDQEGLEALARWTGGKAALNSLRVEALGRAVQDTGSYYWLGFSPSWRSDGQRHAVRLEVRRPGLEVRSRRSFLDLSREADAALALEGRFLLGQEPGAKRLFVALGQPRRTGTGIVEVSLTLGVPTEAMSFQPQGDGYRAELLAHVVWYDKAGEGQDLPPMVLQVAAPQLPVAGNLVRFRETLRVRREERKMRIFIRDPVRDQLLWGEEELPPGTLR